MSETSIPTGVRRTPVDPPGGWQLGVPYQYDPSLTPCPAKSVSFGIGVFVLNENDDFLVATRREGCRGGVGMTALPGGRIEFGETMFDTVVREVLEETGLVVVPFNDGTPFHVQERIGNLEHHVSLYVAARAAGGVLRNREPDKHGDWEWVSAADLRGEDPATRWVPDAALDQLAVIGLALELWGDASE